ncbi:MAG: T9SS type A sorting domain-containing protein [Candidatus Kapaibacterium sp.]|jgi:hypothetical protein
MKEKKKFEKEWTKTKFFAIFLFLVTLGLDLSPNYLKAAITGFTGGPGGTVVKLVYKAGGVWEATNNGAPAITAAATIPAGATLLVSGAEGGEIIIEAPLSTRAGAQAQAGFPASITLNQADAQLTLKANLTTHDASALTVTEGTIDFAGGTVNDLTNTLTNVIVSTAQTDLVLPAALAKMNSLAMNTAATVSVAGNNKIEIATTLAINGTGTFVVVGRDATVTGTTELRAGGKINGANNTTDAYTRTFTGDVTLGDGAIASSIDLSGNYNTNVFGTVAVAALSTLNISNSAESHGKTTINTIDGLSAGTINANGADLTIEADLAQADLKLQTNRNTNLTLTAGTVVPTSVTELSNLVNVGDDIALGADLHIYGNYGGALDGSVVAGGNLTVAPNTTFQVDGIYHAAVDVWTSATVILNGPIKAWATVGANDASLTIGGSGEIPVAASTIEDLLNLTMNRPAATLTMGEFAIAAGGSLTINQGTVNATGEITLPADGIATVNQNGTLILGINQTALAGTVTGLGTIDATGISATFTGPYTFTGNLITTDATTLIFGDDGNPTQNIELNSSVRDLAALEFRGDSPGTLDIRNDLTIVGTITGTDVYDAGVEGQLIRLNGHKLSMTGANATSTLDASNSELDLRGDAAFGENILITNSRTDITAAGDLTLHENNANIGNLTLAGDMTQAGALTINGNLFVSAGTFTALAANNLTITGDVVARDAGAIDLTDGNVTIGGQIGVGAELGGNTLGTITTDATNLIVAGNGEQLQLPAEDPTDPTVARPLGKLTINRPSGVRLNSNLEVGVASEESLVLNSGTLDLNGFNATVATTAKIKENNGNFVTNTGAYLYNATAADAKGALIYTATVASDAIASGIGIKSTDIADANLTGAVVRYPKTIPIEGIGLSVGRVYQLPVAMTTEFIEFEYGLAEVRGDQSGLDVFYGEAVGGGLPVYSQPEIVDIVRTAALDNRLGSVKFTTKATGRTNGGAYATPIIGDIFVLTGLPSDGGILRIFTDATGDGLWNTPSNWTSASGAGVPTKIDQAYVEKSATIAGDGNTFYAKELVIEGHNTVVSPKSSANGDNVNLVILGNLTVTGNANVVGVNNKSKLNLAIGDGVTPNVEAQLNVPTYTDDRGLWVNNFTVNNANATLPEGASMQISGDLNLIGASLFNPQGEVIFSGKNASVGNKIDVAPTSSLEFTNVRLTDYAKVYTNSNLSIAGTLIVPNGSFTANPPSTISFANKDDGAPDAATHFIPWNVAPEGRLIVNHIELANNDINNASDPDLLAYIEPVGDIEVKGNFTLLSEGPFNASKNKITVTLGATSGISEIVNASRTSANHDEITDKADNLNFWNLVIPPNTKATTVSDFVIKNMIDVQQNASFIAENGTIYTGIASATGDAAGALVSNDPVQIKNVSNHTLTFMNLTMNENTITSDSWNVMGNMVLADGKSFKADNGTITFKNYAEKEIKLTDATSIYEFFGLKIADGSKVTTTNADATETATIKIKNNKNHQDGAGLFVEGSGRFYNTKKGDVVIFDTDNMVEAGHPKMIVAEGTDQLRFGRLELAASANNEVQTASSFVIEGTNATVDLGSPLTIRGVGASFNATDGTIEFTDNTLADPTIASLSPGITTLNNVKAANDAKININGGDEIFVRGNVIVDDVAIFDATLENTKIRMIDGKLQKFTGNSSIVNPVKISNLTLDKANNSDRVLLETDVEIIGEADAATSLILNKGILDLGEATLTVGAAGTATGLVARHDGVIDGNKGTYVVNTGHMTPMLEDQFFTVDGTPTLYNLTIKADHATANNLTVNGVLGLETGTLKVGEGASAQNPIQLILNGDLTRTTGLLNGDASKSRLVLQGTGQSDPGISNAYFDGGKAFTTEFARQEALGGNLTMNNGAGLRMNSGVNTLVLGSNTLTLDPDGGITMISGTIDAGPASTVNFGSIAEIPANVFLRSECGTLVSEAPVLTLRTNVRVNTKLDVPEDVKIKTGENILTFGPTMVLERPFSADGYVIGNLKRTVTGTLPIEFAIGNTEAKTPVTLQLASAGNSQEITVTSSASNPTYGRGGDPDRVVPTTWTITPDDVNMRDSVYAKFAGLTSPLAGFGPANTLFPAHWNGTAWEDYRNNVKPTTTSSTEVETNIYPIRSLANLTGTWAVFSAPENTDLAKDEVIATKSDKVMFVSIDPIPVLQSRAFKATVQLQNRYGQPVKSSAALNIGLKLIKSDGTEAPVATFTMAPLTLAPETTTLTFPGLTINEAGAGYQLKAYIDSPAEEQDKWLATVSEPFSVLPQAPAVASRGIEFSNVKTTSLTVTWTNGLGNNRIVVAKAVSPLDLEKDVPVNGQTYVPNTIFGAGSNIGDAVVLYNGDGNTVDVTGLLPNTQYYFYVYDYDGGEGYESYKASLPGVVTTVGEVDDDIAFGVNDTRNLSKTIGTNAPVFGTIREEGDVDWFNFVITSAAPNLRVKLENLAGDYSVEIYDFTGRRIRRSTLIGTVNEAQVANDLPAGTYTVKIFATDGSAYQKPGDEYKLIVNTFGTEIFAVTP